MRKKLTSNALFGKLRKVTKKNNKIYGSDMEKLSRSCYANSKQLRALINKQRRNATRGKTLTVIISYLNFSYTF